MALGGALSLFRRSPPARRRTVRVPLSRHACRSGGGRMRAARDRGLSVKPLRRARAAARLFAGVAVDRARRFGRSGDRVGRRQPRSSVPSVIGCRAASTHRERAADPRLGGGFADDRLCVGARQQRSGRFPAGDLWGDRLHHAAPLPAVFLLPVRRRRPPQILSAGAANACRTRGAAGPSGHCSSGDFGAAPLRRSLLPGAEHLIGDHPRSSLLFHRRLLRPEPAVRFRGSSGRGHVAHAHRRVAAGRAVGAGSRPNRPHGSAAPPSANRLDGKRGANACRRRTAGCGLLLCRPERQLSRHFSAPGAVRADLPPSIDHRPRCAAFLRADDLSGALCHVGGVLPAHPPLYRIARSWRRAELSRRCNLLDRPRTGVVVAGCRPRRVLYCCFCGLRCRPECSAEPLWAPSPVQAA